MRHIAVGSANAVQLLLIRYSRYISRYSRHGPKRWRTPLIVKVNRQSNLKLVRLCRPAACRADPVFSGHVLGSDVGESRLGQ